MSTTTPDCDPRLSYANIFIGLSALQLFFVLIPWFYITSKNFDQIVKEHSTISAYCAKPRSDHWFACRLFAIATVVLAFSLVGLLLEDYNNAKQNRPVVFGMEAIFCLSICLVGVFPSYKDPERINGTSGSIWSTTRAAVAGGSDNLERTSSFLHFMGAILFWLGNTGVNLYYSSYVVSDRSVQPNAGTWVIFALAILSLLAFFTFVGLQIYLKRVEGVARTLNLVSFVIEGLLVLLVTITTILTLLQVSSYFAADF